MVIILVELLHLCSGHHARTRRGGGREGKSIVDAFQFSRDHVQERGRKCHTHLVHVPQLEVLNDLLGFAQLGFPSFQGSDVCVAVGNGMLCLCHVLGTTCKALHLCSGHHPGLCGGGGFENYIVCLSLQHATCCIALNDGQTDLVCADRTETDALQKRGEFQKIGFPSREGLQVRVCRGSREQVCQGLQYHAQIFGGDGGFGA